MPLSVGRPRRTGRTPTSIARRIGEAWIADSYERAARERHTAPLPVATIDGDVFRGPHLVSGGGHEEAARNPRDEARNQGAARADRRRARRAVPPAEETLALEATIAQASERHRGAERRASQAGKGDRRARGADAARRRRGVARGAEGRAAHARARQAEEERDALDAVKRRRARRSRSSRPNSALADERLTLAQRRLLEAREAAEELEPARGRGGRRACRACRARRRARRPKSRGWRRRRRSSKRARGLARAGHSRRRRRADASRNAIREDERPPRCRTSMRSRCLRHGRAAG